MIIYTQYFIHSFIIQLYLFSIFIFFELKKKIIFLHMPLTRPKKIEQYQVLDFLGKGGNGVVYKGIDMIKGTFVAIKQIIIEKTQIKNIKFQINVLKQLNDPFIVKYIDAIQIGNKIYLVLQYLEGGSLGSLVQKMPLQEKLVKRYIKQVLKGLQYLHKHQVAHRDLKGTNILLTKQGKAKITDFGVAIQVNDTQKTLSSAGTPYWMAPQAIINEAATSVECDIWSLGCTVIQLITGNPPYHDLMPYPALFRIVQDVHPPIPEGITALCQDFLMRCFVKDPKKRAKASQLLKHKWIKQINQHKSSSFSIDIQNIVFENDKKIQLLIKDQNWVQLYNISLATTNKKTIYFNKAFYQINNTYNSDQKLKFLKQLITHNYEALKYLSTIKILSRFFNNELKQFKITKLKLIDFIYECYEMCEQNSDLIIFISDFVEITSKLLRYLKENNKEWDKRIVHIAKIIQFLFRLINTSLLIDQHLVSILQENNIFQYILGLTQFIFSLKNAQMSFNTLYINRKYFMISKNIALCMKQIKNFCNISEHFYDFRVLFDFINFLKYLVSLDQFVIELQKIAPTILIEQTIKTLNKLMKLPIITMQEHQILLQLIQFITFYLGGYSQHRNIKKDKVKQFIKLGGAKILTSMPQQYTKNQKIYQNVSGLMEILDI